MKTAKDPTMGSTGIKRLAIVSDAWHPQVNGVVRTLTRTVTELGTLGIEADVIGPDRFTTVPCPSYPEIRLAVDAWLRLPKMLEDLQPAAIHIATEGPLGQAARRYCRKRGYHFTTSFHTRFPEYLNARTGIPSSWTYAWMRRFHAPAQAVLVPTQSIIGTLEGYGFKNLRLWSRGVDTDLFRPAENEIDRDVLNLPRPICLYVGRVAIEKNIRAFLDADTPGTKLVVGDGPQLHELKAAYPEAVFVGKKEGEALASHYAAADVFVFPSRTDTFGLVQIEALACGTPVAAFPVPGPVDILTPQTGVVSEDLGQAARDALKLSRKACRDHALGFSWEACTRQFRDCLEPVALRQDEVDPAGEIGLTHV